MTQGSSHPDPERWERLLDAVLGIGADLSLDSVLGRIVEAASDLAGAQYAALGVLGTVNLPIIHYSVRKWGGNHPTVITKGGGGLHPDMRYALLIGFVAFTLLAVLMLWSRARLALANSRLGRFEEQAAAQGLLDA